MPMGGGGGVFQMGGASFLRGGGGGGGGFAFSKGGGGGGGGGAPLPHAPHYGKPWIFSWYKPTGWFYLSFSYFCLSLWRVTCGFTTCI